TATATRCRSTASTPSSASPTGCTSTMRAHRCSPTPSPLSCSPTSPSPTRDEPGDVAAEVLARDLVDACVVAVVDAAHAGLLGRLAEARELAQDARQRGRVDGEREVVAVRTGEHVGAGRADRAVRARIRRV